MNKYILSIGVGILALFCILVPIGFWYFSNMIFLFVIISLSMNVVCVLFGIALKEQGIYDEINPYIKRILYELIDNETLYSIYGEEIEYEEEVVVVKNKKRNPFAFSSSKVHDVQVI